MYSPGEKADKVRQRIDEIKEEGDLEHTSMGDDTRGKIIELAKKGKIVRGSLMIDAGEAMGLESDDLVDIAAAVELFHTGLLIQDDVFDRDSERRGQEAIHTQYAESSDISEEAARNLAVCAGDVSFFTGMQLLADAQRPSVLNLFGKIFEEVGHGQMTDIASSDRDTILDEGEILDFYRNKTASYTFALPLMAASIIAEEESQEDLKELGLKLGVLYQVKDDEIDFQTSGKKGKPALSDVKQGKNTLHLSKLAEEVDREDLESKIEDGASEEEVKWIYEKMKEEQVIEDVGKFMEEKRSEFKSDISEKVENEELEGLLRGAVDFIVERDK